eukprot:TRINITY_DN1301_c0_g3_i1.p1 TRINITY_DN1301_c0_g3~~TRINITY_DN1301_c0_g3_i1.p1  ORF type:complete len:500 (+),score=173.57 TRINITY_DN1301_c0_g3_i1:128-1627(+)
MVATLAGSFRRVRGGGEQRVLDGDGDHHPKPAQNGKQKAARRWRRLQSLVQEAGGQQVLPALTEDELTVVEQVYKKDAATAEAVLALTTRMGLRFRESGLLRVVLDYVGFVDGFPLTMAQFQRLVQIAKHRLHVDSVVTEEDEMNLRTFEALGGSPHGKGRIDKKKVFGCANAFGLDLESIQIESPRLGVRCSPKSAADMAGMTPLALAALSASLTISSPGLTASRDLGDDSDDDDAMDYSDFVASFMAGDPSATSLDIDEVPGCDAATTSMGTPSLGATPEQALLRRSSLVATAPSPALTRSAADHAPSDASPFHTGRAVRRLSSLLSLDPTHSQHASRVPSKRGKPPPEQAHDAGTALNDRLRKVVTRHHQRLAEATTHERGSVLRGYVKTVNERVHGSHTESLYARRMLRKKFEAENNKKSGYIVVNNGNELGIATRAGRVLRPARHAVHAAPRCFVKWKEELGGCDVPLSPNTERALVRASIVASEPIYPDGEEG